MVWFLVVFFLVILIKLELLECIIGWVLRYCWNGSWWWLLWIRLSFMNLCLLVILLVFGLSWCEWGVCWLWCMLMWLLCEWEVRFVWLKLRLFMWWLKLREICGGRWLFEERVEWSDVKFFNVFFRLIEFLNFVWYYKVCW